MGTDRYLAKVIAVFLFFIPWITSCTGETSPVYQIWIDYPKQGEEFKPEAEIPVVVHVSKNHPFGEVIVRVNEEVIYKGPPSSTNDPLMVINQDWIPDQPGDYTIEVDVKNEAGTTLSHAQVDIHVVGDIKALLPDLVVTDISLEGNDRISCTFINQGGAVLPAGRDVWIDIILGPAESEVPPISRANIGVGDSLVNQAERIFTTAPLSPIPSWPHLVTCRIDVDGQVNESDETNNMMAVTLSGPPVTSTETPTETQPPPPTTEAPPPPTTQAPLPPTTEPPPPPTTEAPPPDTSPPNISGMSADPDRIAELPCAQNTVTISAQVSDPSGVDQVKLYYRATKGSTTGSWQISPMINTSGNQYQVSVGPAEISASYSPYGGLILQYYVKAWDTQGNNAQNKSGNLPLDYCVQ